MLLQIKKYPSLHAMMHESYVVEEGTFSMVTDTSKLYLKVQGGWREIQVIFYFLYSIICIFSLSYNVSCQNVF